MLFAVAEGFKGNRQRLAALEGGRRSLLLRYLRQTSPKIFELIKANSDFTGAMQREVKASLQVAKLLADQGALEAMVQ